MIGGGTLTFLSRETKHTGPALGARLSTPTFGSGGSWVPGGPLISFASRKCSRSRWARGTPITYGYRTGQDMQPVSLFPNDLISTSWLLFPFYV